MSYKNINLVVLDSNFILVPFQFKIDYLNEIYLKMEGKTRFYIFKQCLNELEAKMKRESIFSKFRRQYKAGMKYLEINEKVYPLYFVDEVKEKDETTDDFLLRWCLEFKNDFRRVYMATNDAELRRRAKNSKINVIFVRKGKYLFIERS